MRATDYCLAKDSSTSKDFLLSDLRPSLHVRHKAECRRVADEWVDQMLRQNDAQVFKKYSQMKLQMEREALETLSRRDNEIAPLLADAAIMTAAPTWTVTVQ